MDRRKVAIHISVYNHGKFIREAIESVYNQSYPSELIELHVWDNNSTDNSEDEIVSVISNKGGIFHLANWKDTLPIGQFRFKQVMYPTEAKYTAILDGDDYWHPDKLEKQMKLFDNPKVKLVYSDCYYVHWKEEWEQVPEYPVFVKEKKYSKVDGKTFHDKYPPLPVDPFYSLLLNYNFCPCPTLVFKTSALRYVIDELPWTSAEDYDWVLKMAALYSLDYVPEPLAYYRIHAEQITAKTPARCTIEEIQVVKKWRKGISKDFVWEYRRHMLWLYMKLLYKKILR